MNAQIVHHAQFDPSTVKFASTPAKTNRGSKIVYVNLENGQRVRLQTPIMSAPFGVSTYEDPSTSVGNKSFSIDGSFKGFEKNPALASFMEKCRGLDDRLAEEAAKNSKEWFGKVISVDAVKELTRKLVKDSSDPAKYAPTIRFKIPTEMNGRPACEVYDEQGQLVDLDYLVKGSSFRAIVEFSSVWFVGKQLGITLRVVQIGVVSRPSGADHKVSGFSFVDGEGDSMVRDTEEE